MGKPLNAACRRTSPSRARNRQNTTSSVTKPFTHWMSGARRASASFDVSRQGAQFVRGGAADAGHRALDQVLLHGNLQGSIRTVLARRRRSRSPSDPRILVRTPPSRPVGDMEPSWSFPGSRPSRARLRREAGPRRIAGHVPASPARRTLRLRPVPGRRGRATPLRDDEPVPLRAKVFDTLVVLLRAPGRLVTREELIEAVWPDSIVEEGNLTHNVSALRRARPRRRRRLRRDRPAAGYRCAPARPVSDAEPAASTSEAPRWAALIKARGRTLPCVPRGRANRRVERRRRRRPRAGGAGRGVSTNSCRCSRRPRTPTAAKATPPGRRAR